ncbi:replication-relaxation family protein [Bacillus sp. AFS017336]|uniref:replication-relaxation family protein n=1 Tax=Bacillus sp. AFS017336 TaxID=2033489 RepID=UPI0015CF2E4E|nr:replication-relaxation family protein [Bacillus sp. AFS017336]
MNSRDLEILSTLNKFKCLGRDDLINLFFSTKKSAVSNCNQVLRRLRDRGLIKQSKRQNPAIYFAKENPIKETSQKIPHYLEIFNVYKTLKNYIGTFDVEPKLGPKKTVEPDAFMIMKRTPFFVEVQLTKYSKAVMDEKIKRYEEYYHSNAWASLPWQPQPARFPYIVIFSETPYEIDTFLEIYQFKNANELLLSYAMN